MLANRLIGLSRSRYSAEVLADSPAYYLRLSESSGTTATDVIGAYNGTYNGGISYSQPGAVAGDTNTAVGLNGINAYVSLSPTLATDYAVELSFYNSRSISSQAITGYLFSMGASVAAGDHLGIGGSDGSVIDGVLFMYNGSTIANGSTVLALNTYYTGVVERIGSAVKVYLNGNLEISTTLTKTFSSYATRFGRRVDDSFPLLGRIDECVGFATPPGATRYLAHYNALVGA